MSEIERRREELTQCRRELARIREEQESWRESQHQERRKRKTAERKLRELSIATDRLLRQGALDKPTGAPTGLGRVFGLARRRQTSPLAAMIEASELFSGPWYLRQYPDAALTGLSPAHHYLEIGASQGWDPGPAFDTKVYLAEHPEVAATGTNPLVHLLESTGRDAPAL